MALSPLTITIIVLITVPLGLYFIVIFLLAISPWLQHQIFYLHRIPLVWHSDLEVPEKFGFLTNQVTPFSIRTEEHGEGVRLFAWHVLPPGVYGRNQPQLVLDPVGYTEDITSRLSFRLLQEDPEAWLVLCLHGASGCIASYWRPESYRTIYAADPNKVHVIALDYRGFGRSTGSPTENGVILDAITLVEWAIKVAHIPPARIVILGHSLGTGVSVAVGEYLASQSPPVPIAGLILVASFSDIPTLVKTYRLFGFIPILSPLSWIPGSFTHPRRIQRYLANTWISKHRIAKFVHHREQPLVPTSTTTTTTTITTDDHRPSTSSTTPPPPPPPYTITLIHASNDSDISPTHSNTMFFHAVNAAMEPAPLSRDAFAAEKKSRTQLHATASSNGLNGNGTDDDDGGGGGGGEGGSWSVEWILKHGIIRQEQVMYGGHNWVLTYPVVTLAVMRTLETAANRPQVLVQY